MNSKSNRHNLVTILLAAGLSITAGDKVSAMSRVGEAVVEARDGMPCFRIKDDSWLFKSKFKLSGLSVIDEMVTRSSWDAPYVETWGVEIAAARDALKITRDDCFAYGQLPASMTERTAPQLLKPGNLYTVDLQAQEVGGSIATFGYRALFCLVADSDGRSLVHSPSSREQALTPGPQSCLGR